MPRAIVIERAQTLMEAVSVSQKWRILNETIKKLQKDMGKVFNKQRDAYLAELEKYQTRIDMMSESFLFEADSDDINRRAMEAAGESADGEMQEVVESGVRVAVNEGGSRIISEFAPNNSFYVDDPVVREYVRQQGAELVTRVDNTTRNRIQRTLESGMSERKSYQAIARDIRKQFDDFSLPAGQGHIRDRAELVAVTELGQAFEHGSDVASDRIQSWGITLEKAWQTVEDERVSDECLENQNEGWIPYGDSFPSGDQGPLRFPGCRCTKLRRRSRS